MLLLFTLINKRCKIKVSRCFSKKGTFFPVSEMIWFLRLCMWKIMCREVQFSDVERLRREASLLRAFYQSRLFWVSKLKKNVCVLCRAFAVAVVLPRLSEKWDRSAEMQRLQILRVLLRGLPKEGLATAQEWMPLMQGENSYACFLKATGHILRACTLSVILRSIV